MIANSELRALISQAMDQGLEIEYEIDHKAKRDEGREIIASVRVLTRGQGIGPYPMPPITAGERIREWLWARKN